MGSGDVGGGHAEHSFGIAYTRVDFSRRETVLYFAIFRLDRRRWRRPIFERIDYLGRSNIPNVREMRDSARQKHLVGGEFRRNASFGINVARIRPAILRIYQSRQKTIARWIVIFS